MMPIRSTRLRDTLGRTVAALAVGTAALFLAGCAATPPDHFYTLSGREGATIYHPSAAEAAPFYVEVTDTTIPDDVARLQMVLDMGDGRVNVIEHERWVAPLSTEISQTVSDYLTRSLHTIDVFRSAYSDRLPVYRVSMNVRRFISVPSQNIAIDMVWTVRRHDPQDARETPVVTCRSVVTEKIGAGYDAIAQGHRRGLQQIAADIGGVITTLNEIPPPVPPPAQIKGKGGGKPPVVAAQAAPPVVPCP